MIRVAVTGDVHFAADSVGRLRPHLEADGIQLLLLAGDLTRRGDPGEAAVLARELEGLGFPVVAVLGNHDYHHDAQEELSALLRRAGVTVLEGSAAVLRLSGLSVGIAGVKGFGGGFGRHALGPWGETTIKQFVHEAVDEALKLEAALGRLRTAQIVALLHYSPIQQTVDG
ncbi:MAG: metallophosphoesterase, partial [Candidatus Dormibacteraeota bacterium]|nr:metallophosphoesterase [Candidatus Dormibacteraeota bacterium]